MFIRELGDGFFVSLGVSPVSRKGSLYVRVYRVGSARDLPSVMTPTTEPQISESIGLAILRDMSDGTIPVFSIIRSSRDLCLLVHLKGAGERQTPLEVMEEVSIFPLGRSSIFRNRLPDQEISFSGRLIVGEILAETSHQSRRQSTFSFKSLGIGHRGDVKWIDLFRQLLNRVGRSRHNTLVLRMGLSATCSVANGTVNYT